MIKIIFSFLNRMIFLRFAKLYDVPESFFEHNLTISNKSNLPINEEKNLLKVDDFPYIMPTVHSLNYFDQGQFSEQTYSESSHHFHTYQDPSIAFLPSNLQTVHPIQYNPSHIYNPNSYDKTSVIQENMNHYPQNTSMNTYLNSTFQVPANPMHFDEIPYEHQEKITESEFSTFSTNYESFPRTQIMNKTNEFFTVPQYLPQTLEDTSSINHDYRNVSELQQSKMDIHHIRKNSNMSSESLNDSTNKNQILQNDSNQYYEFVNAQISTKTEVIFTDSDDSDFDSDSNDSKFFDKNKYKILNYNHLLGHETLNTTSLNEVDIEKFQNSNYFVSKNIMTSSRILKNTNYNYTIDQDNIVSFIVDNHEFSADINHIFLNNEFQFDNKIFLCSLIETLQTKIINAREKIVESYQNITKFTRNILILNDQQLENFCIFCSKKQCLMFRTNFKYSKKRFNFFSENMRHYSKKGDRRFMYNLLKMINKLMRLSKTCNLNSFLRSFMKQRKTLFKLINIMEFKSIHMNRITKESLIDEIFHNFKCFHSKIKIQLIPELIPLLFLLLNRNIKIYYQKNKIMFTIFLFYLQSFNHVFNVISRYNLFDEQSTDNKNYCKKMQRHIISFLLRINFVEPLLMLFSRSKKILYRYRFHILSLFQAQCLSLRDGNYNQEHMAFYENGIFLSANCTENLNLLLFFEIYENHDFEQFLSLNRIYFRELKLIFTKFCKKEPYLSSSSFRKCENEEFKKIFEFFEFKFPKYKNSLLK